MKRSTTLFKFALAAGIAAVTLITRADPVMREVTGSSCRAIPIRLAVGLTTQIVFEQEPRVTLFADQTHFKVVTNASAKRSVAIIPVVSPAELERLGSAARAPALNAALGTNLFVFFDGQNQLMLDLTFVPKAAADYLVKIKQSYERCTL